MASFWGSSDLDGFDGFDGFDVLEEVSSPLGSRNSSMEEQGGVVVIVVVGGQPRPRVLIDT